MTRTFYGEEGKTGKIYRRMLVVHRVEENMEYMYLRIDSAFD